jgi:hypothetical protein
MVKLEAVRFRKRTKFAEFEAPAEVAVPSINDELLKEVTNRVCPSMGNLSDTSRLIGI